MIKEFICKVENMSDTELKKLLDLKTPTELRTEFEELLHHHLKETHKLHERMNDINEDKKAFREMFFEVKEAFENLKKIHNEQYKIVADDYKK